MNSSAIPDSARAELDAGLDALGLDRALAAPLLAYLALLLRWNRAYNLTAIRDPREMVGKHLLDSLAMHASVDAIAAAGGSLADLGPGAGLPGIPSSEERRVGKECVSTCSSRCVPQHQKKKPSSLI